MHHPPLPLTHDVVLIGGGHTHALVLRKWGMSPLPGARLTVIHPGPSAPYSGMLPGYVAGHYKRDDLDIDLVRLARFAGARLIVAEAEGLDLAERQVLVTGRAPVAFDLASVNVGITSDMPDLPGFAEHAVPAKPLGPFAARWATYLNSANVCGAAVVGGGVAGAELAMAMAHALRQRGRPGDVTLIDAASALSELSSRARRRVRSAMEGLGIRVIENAPVTRIEAGRVVLTDGTAVDAGFITGAAGARPHAWIGDSGLALNDGFFAVDEFLRTSDHAVFAAGDCAYLAANPRPKAGVYAVREAPVLYHNLRAALSGDPLRRYRPQKTYLKLISLGGKSAVAEKFHAAPSGPLMWTWKDRIDRAFMDRFRDLPEMDPPELPPLTTVGMDAALGDKPLCGGCGAKVGRGALRETLAALPAAARGDVVPLPGDDAALLETGGARQVLTSDHLRAFTADPGLMARIAAVHALGDIWAMGAEPQAATATVILPRMTGTMQRRTLSEIMAAAAEVMTGAGAAIVGGHSSLGDEMTIGFSLTGLCRSAPVTLAGGRPGDALVLTKPLGSGVLMAAEMAMLARGDHVLAAYEHMTTSQGDAARLLLQAHAMTDVTGFGLAGHLLGLCEASGTGARIDMDRVPLMQGAAELSARGVRSSIWADNRALVPELPADGPAALLFDPQTAGGLLAAVPPDNADNLVARLRASGYPAARIGNLTQPGTGLALG